MDYKYLRSWRHGSGSAIPHAVAAAHDNSAGEGRGSVSGDASRVISPLLQSLSGNHLDLADAHQLMPTLADPAVWQSLHEHALTANGEGISRLTLPSATSEFSQEVLQDIVRALVHLPSLTHLHVPESWCSIDLSELRGLQMVVLGCHQQVRARVPLGVQVRADVASRSREKSTVVYVDHRGREVGHPQPVQGLIYERRATDFVSAAAKQAIDAQALARSTRLNFLARFPDDAKAAPRLQPEIRCRDLAVQWIKDRASHVSQTPASRIDSKSMEVTDPHKRFSYGKYVTVDQLAGHVEPGSIDQIDQLVRAGAQAVFEIGQFGDMAADEFASMRMGETRHFVVLFASHVVSLELRAKEGLHGDRLCTEYVLNLYDPNLTAMHHRSKVLRNDLLRGRSIASWIDPAHLPYCFIPHESPQIASLYRWPSGAMEAVAGGEAAARAPFKEYLSQAARTSSQYLRCAMAEGRADLVEKCLKAILADTAGAQPPNSAHLEHVIGAQGGLYVAMGFGKPTAVSAFVDTILSADSGLLPPQRKYSLLHAATGAHSALHSAFMWGRPDTVAVFTQSVLHSGSALERQHMLGLLLSPQTQDPDTHQPVLHHISSTKAAYGKDSATLHNRTQAIYLYLVAILRASTLTPAEKSGFCASAHLGAARVRSTAAQAAMKAHNPEAAAAMVCAVLDTAETRHQGILLASLGVGIREVLSALAGLGPYQRGWLTAVMESIEASGLDPSVISALKREFGPRSSQSPT